MNFFIHFFTSIFIFYFEIQKILKYKKKKKINSIAIKSLKKEAAILTRIS